MGQLSKEISQRFHLNAISNILKNSSLGLTDVSWMLETPQFDSPLDGVSLSITDMPEDNVSKPKAQPTLPLATKSSTLIPAHFHHVQITCSVFSSVDTVQNATFYSVYQNIQSNPLPQVMWYWVAHALPGWPAWEQTALTQHSFWLWNSLLLLCIIIILQGLFSFSDCSLK